jgi:predicted TPR repeat methyltransferase
MNRPTLITVHHATRKQVENLFDVFAEITTTLPDRTEWIVPEWLEHMWQDAAHSQETKQ